MTENQHEKAEPPTNVADDLFSFSNNSNIGDSGKSFNQHYILDTMDDWSVCRICLQTSEKPLKYISTSCRRMYTTVTGISLTDYKSFPTQICILCQENMSNAYKFRELCLETEEKLKELDYNEQEENAPRDDDWMEDDCQIETHEITYKSSDVEPSIVPPPVQVESKVDPIDKDRRILCKRCKKVFQGLGSFKVHRCGTVEKKVKVKKERVRKCNPDKPLPTKTNKRRKICNVCGKAIQTSHYVQHMDYHNGIKRYKCEECGEKFFWWTARRTHIYKEHLKKKVCKCPYCPMEFYITGAMNVHIREVHTDAKDYQCEKCGKEFKLRRSFQKHALTHLEGGMCHHCGKNYGNRLRLIIHMRIHTKRPKADCPICSKTLKTMSNLRRHFKNVHPTQRDLFP